MVAYHSPKTIAKIQKGQSKDGVFELFATAFVTQGGKSVEVQGMRLRVSGPSRSNTRLEIGEVSLADKDERKTSYWFLFEDDRLIAWGRPEEWSAAARRYRIDLPYTPESRPWLFEARADVMPSR